MKKFVFNFFLLFILLFVLVTIILTTIGIETNKFNKFISEKVSQTKNINIDFETIKFKIDPKELSLFLETKKPKISFREISVTVKNIKVYIDFLSLFKSTAQIKKISVVTEEIDISQLKKLSIIIKPSNFKSLLNNKIKEGKLISEIDIFLNEDGLLKDFITKGSVKNLKVELLKDLYFSKMNFNFFADKNDILVKNIFGNLIDIKISDGDIKLKIDDGIKVNSNFNSQINLNKDLFEKYQKYLKKFDFVNNVKNFKGSLNNTLSINLDNTYKVKDYNLNILGTQISGMFELPKPIKNNLIEEEIKEIYFSDLQIRSILKPKKISLNGDGKYSLNKSNFFKINFKNNFDNNLEKFQYNLDYGGTLELGLINYKKIKNKKANLNLNIEKKKNIIKVKKFDYIEGNNSIKIEDLGFKDNKISSFEKIKVVTLNNDFSIQNKKKILIKGSKYDATNLAKFFNNQSGDNQFKNINKEIEIDFRDIQIPLSKKLQNFKLIGEIKKGQFVKISSKGDFGGDNFLDITMKKDKNSNKKYLEIYSDLTRPLLTEYSFFKGLSGGKLLFTSIIDESKSNSKLKIENFKLVNAPGVIKLLSLSDLGGLLDLAEGEGLSFDILEIDMEKNKNFLKINEILALGPSMSVLMEGYQDESGITSLRGTLVPAKTLNLMISKIPVIGKIVIPKEVGEGLFGISFKMKGPKGKIKTSINPIRTITPRFIQKIIERNKSTK